MGLLAALLILIIVMVGAVTYMVMQVYSFRCVRDTQPQPQPLLLGHDMHISSLASLDGFSRACTRFGDFLSYAHGLTRWVSTVMYRKDTAGRYTAFAGELSRIGRDNF